MKKTIACLIVVMLLTACQPPATPTPESIMPTKVPEPTLTPLPTPPALVEIHATKKSQIQGVWYLYSSDVYLHIQGDGGVYVYRGLGNLFVNGTFTFGEEKMTFNKDTLCEYQATYEFYILERNGKTVGMRPQLIGEDKCPDRRALLDGVVFQCVNNPPASCNTP